MAFNLLSLFRAELPPKAPATGEVSFADPSRLFPGGWSTPYNPSELVGQRGLQVFDKMRKDDQVKAALTFKQHSVTAAGWSIKVPEGQQDDWEPAAFCRTVLENLDGSLERSIDGILSALAYGFSISEKVWAEENGKIVLKALKTRRPHEWAFVVDPYGNLLGLKQMGTEFAPDKFVVYAYASEFGNWYGTSDLEAAHRAWWSKRNAYQWMSMLLERLGIPPIMALYNPDAYPGAKLEGMKSILRNMQAATVGIIPRAAPEDLEMWTTEIKNGIEGVFLPALDHYDKDISKALLMPGLIGMTSDDKNGSFARAKVHFDVFMLVTERTRQEIAQHIITEQIIKPLVDLNFGVMDDYPWFEFNPLTDDVRADIMTTWGTLTGQKVVTSTVDDEKHVRTMLQFPELTPEGEKMREQREDLAMQQQQAAADGAAAAAAMTPEQRAALKGHKVPPASAPPAAGAKKLADQGEWVTIDGRHVFIRQGEDATAAIERSKLEQQWKEMSQKDQIDLTESQRADGDVERMQAWDAEGEPAFDSMDGVTDGSRYSVSYASDQTSMRIEDLRDGVMTHNHPVSASGTVSSNPSNGDFRFAASANLKELRVVTKNGVTRAFRPEGGWPKGSVIEEAWDGAFEKAGNATARLAKNRAIDKARALSPAAMQQHFAEQFYKYFGQATGTRFETTLLKYPPMGEG